MPKKTTKPIKDLETSFLFRKGFSTYFHEKKEIMITNKIINNFMRMLTSVVEKILLYAKKG